jgi:maleylacetate reductase
VLKAFIYQPQPARVVFGPGALAQLPVEVARLGIERALVLSGPSHAEAAAQALCTLRESALRLDADGLVALGGGTTTGLAKALALESGLPIVVIPTTYAGSEMTPLLSFGDAATAMLRDARLLPRCVIYDPELTLSMPAALTVTSAFNAIAHAAEALYAPDGNPALSLMAEEGIRAFATALPRLRFDGRNFDARCDAFYGAWLCGTVLGATTMGLHHKLCQLLGGTFKLPHADVHTVVLPHTLAYNAVAAPEAMQRIARAFGSDADDVPRALHALARHHGAPISLSALGMPSDGLNRAADLAVDDGYANPRPIDYLALRDLMQRAYDGAAPEA